MWPPGPDWPCRLRTELGPEALWSSCPWPCEAESETAARGLSGWTRGSRRTAGHHGPRARARSQTAAAQGPLMPARRRVPPPTPPRARLSEAAVTGMRLAGHRHAVQRVRAAVSPRTPWSLPAPREPKLAKRNPRPSTRLKNTVDGVILQSEFVFSMKLRPPIHAPMASLRCGPTPGPPGPRAASTQARARGAGWPAASRRAQAPGSPERLGPDTEDS